MIGHRLSLGSAGLAGSGSGSVTSATALFAGGYRLSRSNVIDSIDVATTGNATDFGDLTEARMSLTSTSNGSNNRAIFAGGSSSSGHSNTIDYRSIATSGNASDFGDLATATYDLAGTSNGTNERAVIGGGQIADSPYAGSLVYVTISSTGNSSTFGDLSEIRYAPAATSNATNNRGVFGGGTYSGNLNVIDYITISSTGNATDFGDLASASETYRGALSSGTSGRGVFGGGNFVVTRTSYVTISTTGNATNCSGGLTVGRERLAGASNGTGNRGVFAGGNGSAVSNVMDYMNISTASTTQDFGDLTVGRYGLGGCSNA